jgi:hypothetical protein
MRRNGRDGRFRTLAEVRRRGQVPRIADVRRDEHIVRDVLLAELAKTHSVTSSGWPSSAIGRRGQAPRRSWSSDSGNAAGRPAFTLNFGVCYR